MNQRIIFFICTMALILGIPVAHTKQVTSRKKVHFAQVDQEAGDTKQASPQAGKSEPEKSLSRDGVFPRREPKKRIVVFSSRGGGGHTAVSNGLKGYLQDEYDITIVNVFDEILRPIDTLGTLTLGKITGEDFYNFCLRCRWTNVAGTYGRMGTRYINWRQGIIEKRMMEYFSLAKPDLIISVIPFVNGALLPVAERLQIPFLILTNDLDTTNYINGIVRPTYTKFKYSLAFDDPALKEKIKRALIPQEMFVITGFPLRPSFFKTKDVKALKAEFNVPQGKPVVMVFMGGAGSLTIYRYVRTLARMKMPLHMIIVLGRNEQLRRNINKIYLPPSVTMTLLGFTDRIADLMAISDVLITKPGPGSVNEAIESNLPMILDQTHGTIWWEELNVTFVLDHGFGSSLTQFRDLPVLLKKYLDGGAAPIKQKMKDFKRESFNLTIGPLIKQLIGK